MVLTSFVPPSSALEVRLAAHPREHRRHLHGCFSREKEEVEGEEGGSVTRLPVPRMRRRRSATTKILAGCVGVASVVDVAFTVHAAETFCGNQPIRLLPPSAPKKQFILSAIERRASAAPLATPLVKNRQPGNWFSRAVSGIFRGLNSAWETVKDTEGKAIYKLFKSQLDIFVPDFSPSSQIEADVLVEKSLWLRNLSVDPAALSLLTPLALPGLNFTSFRIVGDVQVSWRNLLRLDRDPLVFDIDAVHARLAEEPVGDAKTNEQMIQSWLKISGSSAPKPFDGKYSMLDGAVIRVKTAELSIDSPTRYGDILLHMEGLQVCAVDSQGKPADLKSLAAIACESDSEETSSEVSFFRLLQFKQFWASYQDTPKPLAANSSGTSVAPGTWLVAPTALRALSSQRRLMSDVRQSTAQSWTLQFPQRLALSTKLPLLSPAPPASPRDPRLFPFKGPPAELAISTGRPRELPPVPPSRWPRPSLRRRIGSLTLPLATAVLGAAVALFLRGLLLARCHCGHF